MDFRHPTRNRIRLLENVRVELLPSVAGVSAHFGIRKGERNEVKSQTQQCSTLVFRHPTRNRIRLWRMSELSFCPAWPVFPHTLACARGSEINYKVGREPCSTLDFRHPIRNRIRLWRMIEFSFCTAWPVFPHTLACAKSHSPAERLRSRSKVALCSKG